MGAFLGMGWLPLHPRSIRSVRSRSTRDCALLLNVIAGRDPMDSTSLEEPAEDFTAELGRDLKGVRLGIPKEYFVDGMDARVKSTIEAAIQKCAEHGAELVELSLPHTEYHRIRLLYHRDRRSLSQPRPLRRRPLRAPRQPTQGSFGPLSSHTRGGIRRRGEAPHHSRHLCALQRLCDATIFARRRFALSSAGTLRRLLRRWTPSFARRRPMPPFLSASAPAIP